LNIESIRGFIDIYNPTMNEAQAINMCLKDKDPMGFEFLVEQYKREAYYHALSFTNNKEDAADACQDAFRKAFAAMPRLESLDNFYPWFYRILKNHCINLTARKRTAQNYRQATIDGKVLQPESTVPSEELIMKERRASITKVIETLKPDFKEILTLKYFGDKSYDEMAELLEIPRGTVMSRLFHARSAFRNAFQQAGAGLN
jgi:RNA polymerase sigma-70 factor, ECF subfamily